MNVKTKVYVRRVKVFYLFLSLLEEVEISKFVFACLFFETQSIAVMS